MQIPYERFLSATPRLVWAAERRWNRSEAKGYSGPYLARENAVWFVLGGRAVIETRDGRCLEMRSGDWLFQGPGEVTRRFDDAFTFLSIGLSWRWPEGGHLFPAGLPLQDRTARPDLLRTMESVVSSVLSTAGERATWLPGLRGELGTHLSIHEEGTRWARAFARIMTELEVQPDLGPVIDPRLEAVALMIAGWPLDRSLDADAAAAASGLSLRQLQRLYQKHIGKTPAEAFDERRYDHVRQSLLQASMPVKTVAASIGFTDLAAFNRWFQRRAGCPPRAFREGAVG